MSLHGSIRLAALVALLVMITLLSGCGVVYKMEINQGNYVTQDAAERLREGMTRQQVRAILGTPTTESIFHGSRWDYQFTLERRGRPVTMHRLTVHFENDRLKRWESVELPASALVDRDPAYASLDPKAASSERGWFSWLTDWWRR